jgi:hypothetical protein
MSYVASINTFLTFTHRRPKERLGGAKPPQKFWEINKKRINFLINHIEFIGLAPQKFLSRAAYAFSNSGLVTRYKKKSLGMHSQQ